MFRTVKTATWHPNKLKEITYHPACTKPDVQTPEDYQRLLEDVKANGIRHPIQVQHGTNAVVSGRHRIKAAVEAGVPIPVEIIEITDPECWSLSRSELCHRHLTPSRAASLYLVMKDEEAAAMKAYSKASGKDKEDDTPYDDEKPAKKGKEKKEKGKEPTRAKRGEGKTAAKEAKEAGVSTPTMERAKKVKAKGIPALWKAMDAEAVSSADAAFICDFDHDVQKAALALVKNGDCKTLKSAKAQLDKEAKAAAGPVMKDGKGKEVPKKLRAVFEDRETFAILRENIADVSKQFSKLLKRESAKHLPKDLETHLEDIVKALDIYQPFAIVEESEDGWVTKRTAQGK